VALVSFVPVTEEHRDLLRRWLAAPHARAWWDDPQTELDGIYDNAAEHKPFIALLNDDAVAYVQSWRPTNHPDYPWQHGMDAGTRGIDITIGEAGNLNRGIGTLILKHFAAKLFAEGASRLVIDPDMRNERAIACYMKAGFTPYDSYEQDGGTSLLMELLPQDFDYGFGYRS